MWLLAVFGAIPSVSGDLGVRQALGDEPCDLELAGRQRTPRLLFDDPAASRPYELVRSSEQHRIRQLGRRLAHLGGERDRGREPTGPSVHGRQVEARPRGLPDPTAPHPSRTPPPRDTSGRPRSNRPRARRAPGRARGPGSRRPAWPRGAPCRPPTSVPHHSGGWPPDRRGPRSRRTGRTTRVRGARGRGPAPPRRARSPDPRRRRPAPSRPDPSAAAAATRSSRSRRRTRGRARGPRALGRLAASEGHRAERPAGHRRRTRTAMVGDRLFRGPRRVVPAPVAPVEFRRERRHDVRAVRLLDRIGVHQTLGQRIAGGRESIARSAYTAVSRNR